MSAVILSAASFCMPGTTCDYRSRVIVMDERPSRSCITLGGMPASSPSVACVCSHVVNRMRGSPSFVARGSNVPVQAVRVHRGAILTDEDEVRVLVGRLSAALVVPHQ